MRAVGAQNVARVSHIGSTAVQGLLAKPTIDILLELYKDANPEAAKEALCDAGYLCSPQPNNPPPHMMFLKGYTPQGFHGQAYHVHLRFVDDRDELYFRDYLRQYPDKAQAYSRLKCELQAQYAHDRDAYTFAKTAFIVAATAQARTVFSGRYQA